MFIATPAHDARDAHGRGTLPGTPEGRRNCWNFGDEVAYRVSTLHYMYLYPRFVRGFLDGKPRDSTRALERSRLLFLIAIYMFM